MTTWQECFKNYQYNPLITDDIDGKRSLAIGMFLKDDESCKTTPSEPNNGEVPDELRQIYLSKPKDEMFMILQPKPDTNIKDFCSSWDKRIMAFINFGAFPDGGHEAVKKLQYNITQILMCKNLPLQYLSVEKSVNVSRKILIKCDANDTLDDESMLKLPFWYKGLNAVSTPQNLEKELKKLLPEGPAKFLCDERTKTKSNTQHPKQPNFTDNEFNFVKGWLEK
jgi:hypothetical protein